MVRTSIGAAAEFSWDHHRNMWHNQLLSCSCCAHSDQVKIWILSLNFSSPEGQRAQGQGGSSGTLISGTRMSTVDIWQSQFLTWSIPRTFPCGQSRIGKLPPLTSSAITKCFCAGLVKTLKTLVEFSYLQIDLGLFTGFGHVWACLRHYHISQVDFWTFQRPHVPPGLFEGWLREVCSS